MQTAISTERNPTRKRPVTPALAVAACFATALAYGSQDAPPPAPTADPVPAPAFKSWLEKLPDAIKDGKLIFNARVRYDYAEQGTAITSHAFTERMRLGSQTAPWHGFTALTDFGDIRILGSKRNYLNTLQAIFSNDE